MALIFNFCKFAVCFQHLKNIYENIMFCQLRQKSENKKSLVLHPACHHAKNDQFYKN